MNNIPSFRASLIQNVDSNKNSKVPSVEEILAKEPDKSQVNNNQSPQKHSSVAPKVVTALVALTALFYAGKSGLLSKRVQKLLGGKPNLSKQQITDKINAKLNEYLAKTEGTAFDIKVLKNGKTKATRIRSNGNKEIITFDSKTGLPDMRIETNNAMGKKPLQYVTWKGADILDDGFDAANNFYKKFTGFKVGRKHIFGPKYKDSVITYGDMVRGSDPVSVTKRMSFYRDGSIDRVYEKDGSTGLTIVKDMLYGADGKHKGLDIISSDGTIIRRVKGELPVPVVEANRKTSKLQKFLEYFTLQNKNTIS